MRFLHDPLNQSNNILSIDFKPFEDLFNGFPRGKILDIYGEENSGKTAFTLFLADSLQRNGYTVGYIDTDNKLNIDYLIHNNIAVNSFVYLNCNTGEEVIKNLVDMRQIDIFDLIIIDSLPSITSEKEIYSSMSDNIKQTILSTVVKSAAELFTGTDTTIIFTSQLRSDCNGGEFEVGKNVFSLYSSATLKLSKARDIYKEENKKIGEEFNVYLTKSKISKPYTLTTFEVSYENKS